MQTTHGGPATPPLPQEKPALRRIFRQRRRAHVAEIGTEGCLVAAQALAAILTPLRTVAGPVASYAAQGDEIDPRWAESILGSLALPRIAGDDLQFHVAPHQRLIAGPLGILQPPVDAPEISPRLLLVPVLAVARDGARLGQGGGYYDRTLARLRAQGPVIAIAMAFDVQIAEALPLEPHDERMDWIATPTQLVECRQSR
ncbi:5-formyltetrahydrofolate cyclo-ligase [Polymorphobacter sp.]|uniref:5-formyltetrahydrofolate cyclo-ligase n=1 Tax=Polymorphobacter sp. TaxID=1909290 RepID=UPI003F709EB8